MLNPQETRMWSAVTRAIIDNVFGKEEKPKAMEIPVIKINEEQRMAYGWASVISEKGQVLVDTQGDIIEPNELVKFTSEFMSDVRQAKAMHGKWGYDDKQIGEVLHSFPITKELADSLGIQSEREGWIVGVKVHDDEIWEKVKSGKLRAFSIGGMGMREDA